ncbi:trypsin-like peptidase domain-containing protein [Streptomyces sp. LX-29]|uniref:S1C family serine protease n=1 Tax=Streptomyces sp. LX-29 TaxID=2900152 RepID=UPI00240CFB1A|nr:trypsin-like peptidase domain-containing protein [Streptomyces sp. LX-29]WFB08758.1 trypsin-like peptidase domain-containing protein [Streptomyces sp. LX-29]
MTDDSIGRGGGHLPGDPQRQPYAPPVPPATPPYTPYAPYGPHGPRAPRPVTTATGVTVWPGGGTHDSAADGRGGRRGDRRRPGRRSGSLIAAVALVAAALGGGTAALVGNATHRSDDSTATPVVNANASEGGVSAVAKAVGPSIVEISATSRGAARSTGSGVVITADGEIITNNHVIAGADTVTVRFSDGSQKDARVVGTDPDKDLALIEVSGASGLKPAVLGDSDAVQVGDQVVAIGSPEGLTGTVTSGIVSALDREVTVSKEQDRSQGGGTGDGWPFEFGGDRYNGDVGESKTTYKAIQTDASLNPGNSGGALINMKGQIVGINSAMYAPGSAAGSPGAGSVGLGFSIPVNTVKADLDTLRSGAAD